MTGQLIGQYRQTLQVVKQNVWRTSRYWWRPHLVISDYEQSLIAAVETELPNARISGCYFHFGQNLWRRVQSLGLARDYRQNRRLKKTIRKVIAIGYLPMALVRQNVLLLRTSRRTQRLQRQFPRASSLLQLLWSKLFESLSLKCGMFMNETWTPASIITLKVSKNSRDNCPYQNYSMIWLIWFDLLCLTPLSAIFQLYHGDQF